MKKKKKLFIVLGALVILVAIIVINSMPNEYEKHFVDNEANKPYARKVPLYEMDFNEYDYYFQYISAPIGDSNEYVKEIELPCDVNYYARKEDSKPALTLKKGTKIYVKPKDSNAHDPIGYGWLCWPDYDKGWRYGYAFITEEFMLNDFELVDEDAEMYYVKLSELEKVASEYYKVNKDILSKSITKGEFVKNHTLYIDEILCMNGAYLSDELRDK